MKKGITDEMLYIVITLILVVAALVIIWILTGGFMKWDFGFGGGGASGGW